MTTLADHAIAAEVAALRTRNKSAPVRWEPIKDFAHASTLDTGLDRLVSAMASFGNEGSLDVGVSQPHEAIEFGMAVAAGPDAVHMVRNPVMGRVSMNPEILA